MRGALWSQVMRPTIFISLAALGLAAACSPEPAEPTSETEQRTDGEASDPANGAAASCVEEIGREQAEALAEQCRMISPATRPPCNAENSCEMIRGEIARGCAFGESDDNPDFCDAIED